MLTHAWRLLSPLGCATVIDSSIPPTKASSLPPSPGRAARSLPPSPGRAARSLPPSPRRAARRRPARRLALALAALCAALLLAACGSGGSSTITVGNENKADNALIKAGESKSSESTPSTETKTATTPTSGPLSKEPTVTSPGGPAPTKLEIKDLIVGKGAEAKNGESVTVNYVGVLFHGGKEFDASWLRKEPFTFELGKPDVIQGWLKGVPGMKVGGRRELVIPAALAYGSKGSGKIPKNEPLVFVIDLLGV
jgi:peptidylprolyl isomerase